jgi:hypothetical protein
MDISKLKMGFFFFSVEILLIFNRKENFFFHLTPPLPSTAELGQICPFSYLLFFQRSQVSPFLIVFKNFKYI